MATPHFFIDFAIEGTLGEVLNCEISQSVADHLHTLRLKPGEKFILVDTPGRGWELELLAAFDKKTRKLNARLLSEIAAAPNLDLCLIQGISSSERMDQTVRQVTELGIVRIIPLESKRSIVRLDDASRNAKQERWRRIARGAAEQSGQLFLPDITRPAKLEETLKSVSDYELKLLFWEEPGGCSIADAFECFAQSSSLSASSFASLNPPKTAIFVGPEGGFSHDEAALIISCGGVLVSMGSTILRTETAAVVASALTLYHMGGLGAKVFGQGTDKAYHGY